MFTLEGKKAQFAYFSRLLVFIFAVSTSEIFMCMSLVDILVMLCYLQSVLNTNYTSGAATKPQIPTHSSLYCNFGSFT